MVHNMLSENEILCQAFNVTPNASQIWPWVGLIVIEAKRHRWLLPSHNFKIQLPFPPPLEMLNLLLSSSLKEKPFLFGRRLKRKCKSEDKVGWFSFPLSSWAGSASAQPVEPFKLGSNLVILFLAVWLLLEQQGFIYPKEKEEITGTCLLWTNDQNHRTDHLWNQKVNAFLPAHWGNWGPEIGRDRDSVTLLVSVDQRAYW